MSSLLQAHASRKLAKSASRSDIARRDVVSREKLSLVIVNAKVGIAWLCANDDASRAVSVLSFYC